MTDDELRPCPFCGSTNLDMYYFDMDDNNNLHDPGIRCNCCKTTLRFDAGDGDLDSIQRVWNRRVKE